jgi:hypothetical protein
VIWLEIERGVGRVVVREKKVVGDGRGVWFCPGPGGPLPPWHLVLDMNALRLAQTGKWGHLQRLWITIRWAH